MSTKMSEKERCLTAYLLTIAADEFGNHGCNDVEDRVWESWTIEERQAFVKAYHEWNGDPKEYDPSFLHLPDFALMQFLAARLTTPTD